MESATPATLDVAIIGHLVARGRRPGRVHSVFTRACNIASSGTLLTILAPQGDDGPTTLRLADGAPIDLSEVFTPDERVEIDAEGLRTHRVALRWREARVWRPEAPSPLASAAAIAERLQWARALLDRRAQPASVLTRFARPPVAGWRSACARNDRDNAERCIDRLIGLGEGLTPAGDDFLAGALAALDAFAIDDPARRVFRDAIARTIVERLARTTPIAAHLLRLASEAHHGHAVLRLRDALLARDPRSSLDDALTAMLAIGATSGADTVRGLLTTIDALLESQREAMGTG